MSLPARLDAAFRSRFGSAPTFLARAPGRVNLIGEHTDYNDGFVLPVAIDRNLWLALAPRNDGRVLAHSLDFDTTADFALDRLNHAADGWPQYLRGVAWALQQHGHTLRGWQGVLAGDIPVGAGLSSSAALELAVARAFQAVSGFPWRPQTMARIAQRAENDWVGMNCGIMDQMISACARAGSALLIDCRSLAASPLPLPPHCALVVMDSNTRRGLVDSAYNQRRAQCEQAARHFNVPALRDLDEQTFARASASLAALPRRRARHVITENARTLAAADALRAADAPRLGALMNAGHESLRDDFEVSTPELDALVESAQRQPGCLGARMTGAGFGGCALALLRSDALQDFLPAVRRAYGAATDREATLYVCRPATGAELIPL